MKATDVIKLDHEAAKALFEEFEAASEDARREIEKKLFKALAAHEVMEDRHFYPALKMKATDADDDAVSEVIKEQLALEATNMGDRALEMLTGTHEDRVMEVKERVLAHAAKEESVIFPIAESLWTAEELEELGAKMEPDSAVAKAEKDD
jgi:hemerythrin superfamily protein